MLNQPYGGFPWISMPQLANENWYNAHNFYGDLAQLDAATLEDVRDFFRTYYAPNNAALVVVGDFEPRDVVADLEVERVSIEGEGGIRVVLWQEARVDGQVHGVISRWWTSSTPPMVGAARGRALLDS